MLSFVSGGSDGLTIASLSDDFYPVWGNSEVEIISQEDYQFLKLVSKHLINLPDVDTPGIEFAYKYSHHYWKLDTVFIPKYYLGDKGKDFRDFVNYFDKETSKEVIADTFRKMLAVPVSFNFMTINERKQNRISVSNLHYFLNANYFHVYISQNERSSTNENQGVLLKEKGYILECPSSAQVADFCIDFLVRKGTTKPIIDYMKSSNMFSDKELKKVPAKEYNLVKYDKDYQLFFFENTAVKVTANGVQFLPNKDVKNYVFKENIIKSSISKSKETFLSLTKTKKETIE